MKLNEFSYSRRTAVVCAALMLACTSAFAQKTTVKTETKDVVVGGKTQTQEVTFWASAEYLPDGKLKQTKDVNGTTVDYTYTQEGWLKSQKSSNKTTVSYTYNRFGNVTKKDNISQANGRFSGVATHYDYDENQNMIREWAENYFCEYEYDESGRKVHSKDSKGLETWFEYDKNGNLILVKDSKGNSTTYTFDKKNKLTKMSDSDGMWIKYKYNKSGSLVYWQDSEGNCKEIEYNDKGLESYSRDNTGKCIWTEYSYDGAGVLTQSTSYSWQGNGF